MPQELLFLVQLLTFHINKKVLKGVRNGLDREFNKVLNYHLEQCRGIIMNNIYAFQGDQILIANYISFLNLHLVDIDDRLIGLKRPFPKLSSAIVDLTEFLFKHYVVNFNLHSVLPYSVIERRILAHDQKIQFVLLTCESFHIMSGLFPLIRDYLNQKNHSILSFVHIRYYTLFVEKIYDVCIATIPEELESKLWSELVYINYNSAQFSQLIVQAYRKRFSLLDDKLVLELDILRCIRTVKQLVDNVNLAFDPTTMPVKDQMLSFLYSELEYLHKTKHL